VRRACLRRQGIFKILHGPLRFAVLRETPMPNAGIEEFKKAKWLRSSKNTSFRGAKYIFSPIGYCLKPEYAEAEPVAVD
jgi:hypothetical protein